MFLSFLLQVGEIFLSGVFCVGQLVSCVVLRLDDDKKEKGSRKIWLSLRLSLLHKNYNLDVVQEGMVCHYFIMKLFVVNFFLNQSSRLGFSFLF